MSDDPAAIIAYTGQCKTMADGTMRMAVDFQPADAKEAFQIFGEPNTCIAVARLSRAAPGNEKKPHGPYAQQAKSLYLSSFFRTPAVWEAVGTDDQFLTWIGKQPSAYSGKLDNYEDVHGNQVDRNIAAHVRRVANGSGTGIKPEYSAIPLTMEEHDVQHQRGETALKPREWFEEKRIEYVHRWCWEALKDELCYASWGYVPPDHLLAWAEKHDLVKYLPGCYRGDSNG